MSDYLALADELALDIREGRLRPGARLLPQRELRSNDESRARPPAGSTQSWSAAASLPGEVGRGTYVRAAAPLSRSPLAEPHLGHADLELNFPSVPEQSALLARSLGDLFRRPESLDLALRPIRADGTAAARRAAATCSRGVDGHLIPLVSGSPATVNRPSPRRSPPGRPPESVWAWRPSLIPS